MNQQLQTLKFLLRRIENDVDRLESTNQLIQLLKEEKVLLQDIFAIIEKEIMEKDVTLNRIAVPCFENECYPLVLPLLNKSLQYNPANTDTLYNLGYILYSFKEDQMALDYLKLIQHPDDDILSLIQQVEEALQHE